jgi:hypothetical protein
VRRRVVELAEAAGGGHPAVLVVGAALNPRVA